MGRAVMTPAEVQHDYEEQVAVAAIAEWYTLDTTPELLALKVKHDIARVKAYRERMRKNRGAS